MTHIASIPMRIISAALTVGLLLASASCANFRTCEISKNFNKDRHHRVGLLVTRVGNEVLSSMAAITLQTDYSRRISKPQSTMGLTPDSVDVYIEDDNRIRESIPSYPKFKSATLANFGPLRKQSEEYFRNITPELYTSIAGVFREKGYDVVDVRKLAKTWNKPLSEMTIEQILTSTSRDVDVLAVFHYMDVANTYLYAITINSQTNGLAFISYELSMFDSVTKEELLFFKLLFPYDIQVVMSHDPNILSDPRYKDRIQLRESEAQGSSQKTFSRSLSHQLTDSELVQIAVRYICYGVTWTVPGSSKNEWRGLNSVVP